MADRVERDGIPDTKPGAMGTPRFGHAAEQVLHALAWDLANAGAHYLAGAAARADAAEAQVAAETVADG